MVPEEKKKKKKNCRSYVNIYKYQRKKFIDNLLHTKNYEK